VVQAHDVEIRSADHARADFARSAQADHGETDLREVAERGQGFDARFQILNLRH
jgi:hypothetical protein